MGVCGLFGLTLPLAPTVCACVCVCAHPCVHVCCTTHPPVPPTCPSHPAPPLPTHPPACLYLGLDRTDAGVGAASIDCARRRSHAVGAAGGRWCHQGERQRRRSGRRRRTRRSGVRLPISGLRRAAQEGARGHIAQRDSDQLASIRCSNIQGSGMQRSSAGGREGGLRECACTGQA